MRQPSIIVLLVSLFMIMSYNPSLGAIKGGIKYSIPVDYSKLSESELSERAKVHYHNALRVKRGEVNKDVTNALMTYSILEKINPDSLEYCIKLGELYGRVDLDKYSKGYFFKAMGIDKSSPWPYYYLGDFYYDRQMYRKALKNYNEAYKKGLNTNYDMLYNMGDIYEKFGDTKSALKFLREAGSQSPNPDLNVKIQRIEAQDATNREFYTNTRIRG